MFTSVDKALTALVMAVLFLLNRFARLDFGLDQEAVGAFVAGITPILVWLIPNRAAR